MAVMTIGLLAGVGVQPVSAASAASPPTASSAGPIGSFLAGLHDPGNGGHSDYFGVSVAASATHAVVSAAGTNNFAGAVYIYKKGAHGWNPSPEFSLHDPAATANDLFGSSVAISGTTVVVGASGHAGAAYIYVRGTAGWPTTPSATLADPAATANDVFGSSVAISGTTVVVGAGGTNFQAGAAYIYVNGTAGWPTSPTASLTDPAAHRYDAFGGSVAVSGTTAVVSAAGTDGGACFSVVYIYGEGIAGWPTAPQLTLHSPASHGAMCTFDSFGVSVAVSKRTLVVGSHAAPFGLEAAYIYTKSHGGWPTTPSATLADPAATDTDVFGSSVAVSGTTVVVGAQGTNSEAGAAYIYVNGTAGWPTTPTATLVDPALAASNFFGISVAVAGTTAIIGASTNSKAGAADIYTA